MLGRQVVTSLMTHPIAEEQHLYPCGAPHPLAPSDGASLALLGPAIGLVDRPRDAATGRGH